MEPCTLLGLCDSLYYIYFHPFWIIAADLCMAQADGVMENSSLSLHGGEGLDSLFSLYAL